MTCPYCEEEEPIADLWLDAAGPNSVEAVFCCEGMQSLAAEDPAFYRELLEANAGLSFLNDGKAPAPFDTGTGFALRYQLEIRPIRLSDAKTFVRTHHRHNKPPAGWKFGTGIYNGPTLIGVVMVGRPKAAKLDSGSGGTILEVNRLCLDASLPRELLRNACTKGYGWAAREAERRGFRKIITYTLEDELSTSVKATGWTLATKTRGGSWHRENRPREDTAPTCPKQRWEKTLSPRRSTQETQ